MSAEIHISLAAEPIAYVGSFPVTNSMFTSIVVSALIIGVALIARMKLKNTDKPTGLQNFAEMIVESFFKFCHSITGDMAKAKVFLPVIGTFFLFIMLNNWAGLVPGVGTIFVPVAHAPQTVVSWVTQAVASEIPVVEVEESSTGGVEVHQGEVEFTDNPTETPSEEAHAEEGHTAMTPLFRAGTADLNMTIALGLITIILVQFYGFKYQHFGYLKKYFNFSSPIMFFVGILEIISEIAKIISFAFRLFGNVFAGEVLIAVILFLTKVLLPVPFYGLEVFVGMMQALVFSMLSLVFYNIATQGHDEH